MSPSKSQIQYLSQIPDLTSIEELLATPVLEWVSVSFDSLNDVQKMAIPRIVENKSTLVMAPTGAGKTLAAFLGIISELQRLETEDKLEDRIYALYVSPLKALNNDIHKNLEVPLQQIKEKTGSHITAAKRTGDTTTKERQRLRKNPPHILITTPESLGLMLAAPKFKKNLRGIRWLIVDEIHSLADNKRGSLLSICLERLEHYLERPLTRIGLSATVEPIELVGHYLTGNRDTTLGIVDMGGLRELELDVIAPVRNLVHAPFSMIEKQHLQYLKEYTEDNRTILIFTNTRHLSERLVYDLIDLSVDEYKDKIAVHHGSLDKKVRLEVEERLKKGEMKAVFTSTSLEMGIDIGSIDMTVQLGSPKTVRSLLQRIGRSGHSQDLVSKGKILVFSRDDLIECTVIAKLAKEGNIDAIRIPSAPKDVLIQMLVGMAVEKKWEFREAYDVISNAYPYKDLKYEAFLSILERAADPTGTEDSWKYGHIWMDKDIKEFGRRRSARQAYLQNIGTIPDVTSIDVVLQGFRTTIGHISERFAEKLQEGDVFILGGKTYQFVRSLGNKILVEDAPGMVPTIPSWGGEAQSRTWEVSQEISYLLETVERHLEESKENAIAWLQEEYPIGPTEAGAITDYVIEQLSLAPVPTLETIPVEIYTDPSGSSNILALMLYGLETNQAIAQTLASILSDKLVENIGYVATDNGILLRIPPGLDYDHRQLFDELETIDLEKEIRKSLHDTELFKLRFRHAAARSLMILRRWGRKSIPVSRQQRTARWLLKSIQVETPVIEETFREILYDTYNIDHAQYVIDQIRRGDISIVSMPPGDVPSSMTHDLLLNGELDVVMMNDRRSLLMTLHQQVLSRILPEFEEYQSILDEQEVDQYFSSKLGGDHDLDRRIRNLVEFPKYYGKQLDMGPDILGISENKLKEEMDNHPEIIHIDDFGYILDDSLPFYAVTKGSDFWADLDLSDPVIERAYLRAKNLSPDAGWEHLITAYLRYAGPTTPKNLASDLNTTVEKLDATIQRLLRKNIILQGNFVDDDNELLLFEDREHLSTSRIQTTQITENQLKDFRLYKMRLVQSSQSNRMTITDYLKQNGPARDPMELVSRIKDFSWIELRRLLARRDVYFGRFLGRRLVFVHHNDIEDLIRVTRSDEPLDEYSKEILTILSENPGYTQKELSRLTNQPASKVSNAINRLEEDLYIARTGFDLTLTHGGFPNPRYIPLPFVDTSKTHYQDAVVSLLEKCTRWYGPLTLHDLLRITRLPYPVVESSLEITTLDSLKILGQVYYGHDYDFDHLVDFELDPAETELIHLLSPLDPYFYMTSGSFRREQLPRQTRLTIIYKGLPKGHIEVAIPDKDILQVLNLQISKRNLRDFSFLQAVGVKLREIGKHAYQTTAVYIEEINFKAANHPDNKGAVTVFNEIGYALHIDHLVTGTGKRTEFSRFDISATRQLIRQQFNDRRYSSCDKLFERHAVLPTNDAVSRLDAKPEKAKLLLSHYLRKGKAHYHKGKLYRDDIYKIMYGRENHDHSIDEVLDGTKTISQIAKSINKEQREVSNMLYELLNDHIVEVVSPFAKSIEYRSVPRNSFSLSEKIERLILHVVNQLGPISFNVMKEEINQYLEVSRIQLLIMLSRLLKNQEVISASIRDQQTGTKQVMYFTDEQEKILTDPGKKQYFKPWHVYEFNDKIFDTLSGTGSHIIVNHGEPVATFSLKRDNDLAIIENIHLTDHTVENKTDLDLKALLNKLESFVFDQGLQRIVIEKIQGAQPQYWIDLQTGDDH